MPHAVSHYLPVLPELFVLVMACVTLLVGVFNPQRIHVPYYLVQITLLVVALITYGLYAGYYQFAIVRAFDGAFALDHLAVALKMFIYLMAFMSFVYARRYNDERFMPATEFYCMGLLSVLGMMVLVSSQSLLPLYLGLELFSLPIYAMVALQRAKARCIEASMKYFIIGAVASGMLLYGLSLLFGISQTLMIHDIARAIQQLSTAQDMMAVAGLVFVIAGAAFKLGAAPFHMWVPDVYDGSPTSVTLFLGSAPKLAAFGLAVRMFYGSLAELHVDWQPIILFIAIVSIALGNMVAIVQSNIKRLLAYSSIAHMGYMLLGFACGTQRGEAAAMFYMISYAVMTLGAFGMVVLMSRAGFEANEINDYAGLNSRNPWLAFMMLLVLFSLAGIPPLVGFMAKVGILEALISVHLEWVAVLAILFAIVGAYYYIRVVKVMYFEDPSDDSMVETPYDATVAMTVTGLATLFLGMFPGQLFAICHSIFQLA